MATGIKGRMYSVSVKGAMIACSDNSQAKKVTPIIGFVPSQSNVFIVPNCKDIKNERR
jgi:hypothetical protein